MKKNVYNGPITCTIGATAEITGSFISKEATRIDGVINGDVTVDGALTMSKDAVVNGNVKAISFITAGKITGDITVKENIEILGTAVIKGNIECATMVMDENAFFEGNCKMNRPEETKGKKETKKDEKG